MDSEERPLLHFADLVLALLHAAGRDAADIGAAARLLAEDLAQAREPADNDPAEIRARLDFARRHLVAAHLLEMLDERRFRITPRGRALLHANPGGIDDTVLTDFPEFRRWLERPSAAVAADARLREFQRGWAAQRDGVAFTENPFAGETAQRAAWDDGWLEAERG